jgi:UDP-glucose 4-epimerase
MKKIKGKNIIVIGGAGFIGSHLIEKLITNNNVVSIDNYLSGTEDNHFDGAKYIVGSCENISQLVRYFSPNLIFHLGEYSRVESSFDDYQLVIDNNLAPFSKVLLYAKEHDAKLIYSGSSTKFAHYNDDEIHSPYAWVKSKNTEHLINYAKWFSLEYAIVYFYNAYGGNEIRDGKYSTLIGKYKKLYASGERNLPVVSPGTQLRNFTHYSDIISGLEAVAIDGNGDGYGIGSDKAVSILDIVNYLRCSPSLLPSRRGNRQNAELVTKNTKEIGWSAKVDIEEYLRQFVSRNKD